MIYSNCENEIIKKSNLCVNIFYYLVSYFKTDILSSCFPMIDNVYKIKYQVCYMRHCDAETI